MLILVINCGSSSIKYQLLDMNGEKVLAKGLVERIGLEGARLLQKNATGQAYEQNIQGSNHSEAIQEVLAMLTDAERGVISDVNLIDAIGHRVVHGGEKFANSALVTPAVLAGIRECADIAPLHNPPNITGIEACQAILPNTPQAVVFDTSFHQTMPKPAYLYGLPLEYYQKYGIRRYGFHGTSHSYVAHRVAELEGKPLAELKVISCHLGNGSSVTAIAQGKSIATSMGFTPLEGLVMGTRTGDLDPAVVLYLMEKEGLSSAEINNLLNKQSGVLGVSGLSSDFRDLEQAAEANNEAAALAIELFVHSVKKYIGAYTALLNGLDCLVFTAGVGENSPAIRSRICADLDYLGVQIDPAANDQRGKEAQISPATAKTKVWVVPTNEELMIARDTVNLINMLDNQQA